MDHNFPADKTKSANTGGGICEILALADKLQRSGRDIIHMEIGRPDFDSPQRAKDAAMRALAAGQVHYTDMAGTPELRAEIAAKYRREAGMEIDPDREVVVTAGATEALLTVFSAMLASGDEVLIPAPYFPLYDDQVKMAGGVVRRVPCRAEKGFRPQAEDIERSITPRTRIILINTPNNPTGAASTRAELAEIAELSQKHDLLVISDECYEKFAYDADTPHISIATFPGMRERTFTLSSASKTFSMTGWRVGWLIILPETRERIMTCHQGITMCTNSFAQAGVTEALRSCEPDVERMIGAYRKRRDLVVRRLSEIDGIDVATPDGAFYVFPNIARIGVPSFTFCEKLLEETGVACVPGQPFGVGDGYMRLAYCRPESEIEEAIDRLGEFVARIRR